VGKDFTREGTKKRNLSFCCHPEAQPGDLSHAAFMKIPWLRLGMTVEHDE
jgi:hypothetical protein